MNKKKFKPPTPNGYYVYEWFRKVFVIFKKQNPINKDDTVSSLEGRKIRQIPPYKKM